jgi:hypothetical protein
MRVVLQLLTRADGVPSEHDGRYLQHYDPDHEPLNGIIITTADIAYARHFADGGAALALWRQVSRTLPRRLHDGAPNRPLTGYTCEVVAHDDRRAR